MSNKVNKVLWLSFCDGSLPKGSQFLGVFITEADSVMQAAKKAWDLNMNPGGEIQSVDVTNDFSITPEHMDRLMSKDEVKAYGFIE
jgi:hypothetical protein